MSERNVFIEENCCVWRKRESGARKGGTSVSKVVAVHRGYKKTVRVVGVFQGNPPI